MDGSKFDELMTWLLSDDVNAMYRAAIAAEDTDTVELIEDYALTKYRLRVAEEMEDQVYLYRGAKLYEEVQSEAIAAVNAEMEKEAARG